MTMAQSPHTAPKTRRPRRPTLAALLRQAEGAGKRVTSAVATSDGFTLHFGEPASGAAGNANGWDEVLTGAENP
jgi:hypothetical protein